MKSVLLLFVAAVSWKGVGGQSCITVSTDIVDAELLTIDTTVRREYILCPNTTIETGYVDPTTGQFVGDFPIAVRANATVKCGADGSRSNNCKLILGDIGILMTPFDGVTPLHDQEEVIVQGITIEDHLVTPLFMNFAYGKVKFLDCAFLVRGCAALRETFCSFVSDCRCSILVLGKQSRPQHSYWWCPNGSQTQEFDAR